MGGAEETAGGSAADRAGQLRAKADRLKAEAERYERGAEGERVTARLLAALPAGWMVRHDLSIPGSKANIDHVAIGPPGVFVIDSKNWRYPARVSNGTLWCSKYPKRQELETVVWETRKVTEVVADAAPVTTLLCLHGPVEGHLGRVGNVNVLPGSALLGYLVHQPAVLDPDAVLRSVDQLDRLLPGKVSPPLARPAPGQSLPPAPSPSPPEPICRPARPPSRPGRAARPRSVAPAPTRRPQRRSRSGSGLVSVVGPLVACGVLFFALPHLMPVFTWLGERFSDQVVDSLPSPTATTAASPSANATPTPLQVVGWSCPGAGSGWTANVTLDTAGGTWKIETSPTPTGPWGHASIGFSNAAKTIGGVKAAQSFYARGATLVTLSAAPASVPVVPVTAPATTC